MKEDIFISYAWSGSSTDLITSEQVVSNIEKALKKDFNVIIDKKDLKYKSNIQDFEDRLGKGNKIVLIICDKYLKSKHCMYEVMKIKENGNVYDRVYPIILKNATTIYDSSTTLDYIIHWEDELQKLNEKIKRLRSQTHINQIRNDLDNYTNFRLMFDDFRGLLSKMNTLTPEIHQDTNFKALLNLLKEKQTKKNNKSQKKFLDHIGQTKKMFEKSITIVEKEIENENVKAEDILDKLTHFYAQSKNQSFQIAVMAMVKSGKSTFLNSLLGDELLPMSNVPETSVPIRISHTTNKQPYFCFDLSKIEGAIEIRKQIAEKNKEKREVGLNEEPEYHLHASFKVLEEKQMDDIKFEIIDTPGFGEALNPEVVGKSINQSNDELIDKISAVIYLLDYSKLNTQEEKEILQKLSSVRADILEKIKDRLFFVINQIDKEDRNSLPPESAVDYVFSLVNEKMPDIDKKHILHVSARNALLARLIINNNATKEARYDFGKIAFGVTAAKATQEDYIKIAHDVLQDSNILEVEDKIINYIYDNRSRIFIEGLLDNLKRILNDFKNKFVITAEGALNKTIQEIEELESKIDEAKKKQENIQDEAEKFEKEIKDWIEGEFKKFEKTILDDIDSAFNWDKAEEKKPFSRREPRKWVKKIQTFLKDAVESTNDKSKKDIEQVVRNINLKIHSELSTSFSEFKKDLEQKILSQQSFLFENLKVTINSLAREFELTLKKTLHINLEIVELRIDAFDINRALNQADSFIERFIKSNPAIKEVQREKLIYNPGSWCEEGWYSTQYVVESELTIENQVNKYGLEIHWKKEIESMNSSAKKITIQLIESNIKNQIKNARKSFNSYVNDYLTTIQEQKIKLSRGSRDEIENRLMELKKINNNISSIISEIESINHLKNGL